MRKKILLVEEDPDLRMLFSKFFLWEGCEVLFAKDEATAIERVSDCRFKIDLVILNLSERQTDDPTQLEKIAALLPDAKILLVSNFSPESEKYSSYPYMTKPFYPESLVYRVKKMLSGEKGLFMKA